MRRRLAVVAVFLATVGAAGWAETRLHGLSAQGEAGDHLLYLPSGKYLKALAPGYNEVLADLIYLWSIQYYGEYDAAERYEYLDHIYRNVITELDPRYTDPYLIGALIMAMEARKPEMAVSLLDKGIEANPDDWLMAFEAGFYCYDTLHDYKRAARYFERALKVPGVHPIVRRLHAEMYNKMGDVKTSLRYWLEIYQTAEDDYVRSVSYRHAHDLRIRLDLQTLSGAVSAFKERYGRLPARLEELAEEGILPRLPKDPEGNAYQYNRNTGEVRSLTKPLMRRPGS